MTQPNYLTDPADPDRFITRSIVLTEKAHEYLRQQRLEEWKNGPGLLMLEQVAAEAIRQRGWKKWTTYHIGSTEFPNGVTIYGDPGPRRDCSICWREHGDEIQHVCE